MSGFAPVIAEGKENGETDSPFHLSVVDEVFFKKPWWGSEGAEARTYVRLYAFSSDFVPAQVT